MNVATGPLRCGTIQHPTADDIATRQNPSPGATTGLTLKRGFGFFSTSPR